MRPALPRPELDGAADWRGVAAHERAARAVAAALRRLPCRARLRGSTAPSATCIDRRGTLASIEHHTQDSRSCARRKISQKTTPLSAGAPANLQRASYTKYCRDGRAVQGGGFRCRSSSEGASSNLALDRNSFCAFLRTGRVTKKSLWWQHEKFPSVWTSEGLSTCMETSYQWTVNSTTWNHLQAMWQATPLDLLRLIHEETHHQIVLEASGYRSPTCRILCALKSIFQANGVVGESTITAAPFFEGAGRPSKPFWGPQQG